MDIACLLLIAKGRRQRLRARCPGDRFRAAMAILKQEKERMRGKWSLDSTYEWPDDGDEDVASSSAPAVVAAVEAKPFFPVTASAFGTPVPSRPRDGRQTISAPSRRQPSHTYMFVGKFWSS